MEKIKIIDLYKDLVNGKHYSKINYNGFIYKYDGDFDDYIYREYIDGDEDISYFFGNEVNSLQYALKEVEIIEEDKKIEKLDIRLEDNDRNQVNFYRANNLECDLARKINEIIDYINKENK